jgi:hypothetical protein
LDSSAGLQQATEIPSPHLRLCKKHNRPIIPSAWKSGHRTLGCTNCFKICRNKGKVKRTKKWSAEIIYCIYHPDRRCSKSCYVRKGERYCRSCKTRNARGNRKPSHKRGQNRASYRKIIQRRAQLRGRLRGIELFERVTGMKVPRGMNG